MSAIHSYRGKKPQKRWIVLVAAVLCLAIVLCAVLVLYISRNRFDPPVIQGVKEEIAVYMDDDIQAILLEGVTAVGGEDRPDQVFPVRVEIYSREEEVTRLQPGTYRLVYRCDDEKEKDALPVESTLTVYPADTEPPVIEGARDLTVTVGDSVSYREGVTVSDNADETVRLMIDAGQVDTAEPGTYPVTYSAQDARGNRTSVTVTVTVERAEEPDEPDENGITMVQLNELADGILGQLLTPDMTQREQAMAIFDYVRTHITYVGDSDKSTWRKGAYVGFTQRRGDCFNYFACSKALLTRAGIPNIDLERVGGVSDHYWQLVNVGDGWYHFDTCPHPDDNPLRCFLLTEEQVRAYSATIANPFWKNYYVYDYDACPVWVEGTPGEGPGPAEQQPGEPPA